jgi:hypothetical protein
VTILPSRSSDLGETDRLAEETPLVEPDGGLTSDKKRRICLVDLEQCTDDGGNKTWDLAEFIYYSVRFTLKEERARRLVAKFVQGYLEDTEDQRIVEGVGALRYRAPFQAFIAPNVMSALRRDLEAM